MKISFKKTRLFWLYIVIGILSVISGVIFAPPWKRVNIFFSDWGSNLVRIMMGVAIFLYVIFFLAKKVKASPSSAVQMLTVVEIVLLSIIGLGCILSQLEIISIGGPCHILGLAFWCRGTIEVFRGYFHYKSSSSYSVINLVVAIIMITFGTFIFAKPFFNEVHLQWIFSGVFVVVGILFIIYGARVKPSKG